LSICIKKEEVGKGTENLSVIKRPSSKRLKALNVPSIPKKEADPKAGFQNAILAMIQIQSVVRILSPE